jgi:hypothetical protein
LFVARYIVMDAQEKGIHHFLVAWIVPLTLMAGPAGLATYLIVRAVWHQGIGKYKLQ